MTLKVLQRDSNSRRESHPPPLDASVCRMSRRLQRQTRLMRPIKRNPSGRRFTISLREFKSAVPVRSFIYSVSSRTLFALTPRLASLIYEPAMINENAFTCSNPPLSTDGQQRYYSYYYTGEDFLLRDRFPRESDDPPSSRWILSRDFCTKLSVKKHIIFMNREEIAIHKTDPDTGDTFLRPL